MVSRQPDFDEFVRLAKQRSRSEILDLIDEELHAARARHEKPRTDAFRRLSYYMNLLGGLSHLLQAAGRPFSVQQDYDFLRMRPMISALVERSEL